jgi:serine phosphatase RsbU (regulator of sigma subunit)
LNIAFDKKKNEFWIGTINSGVIRLFSSNEIEIYDNLDGIDISYIKPIFNLKNELVFATKLGLQKFTFEEEIKKSLPDSLKNKPEFYRGFFEPIGNEDEISDFFEFKNKSYLILNNEIKCLKKENIYKSEYRHLDFGRINNVHKIDGDIYFSTSEGIVVLEKNQSSYKSFFKLNLDAFYSKEQALNLTNNQSLTYKNNDLTFKFSAPFFLYGTHAEYRYKLNGQDENWSNFSRDSKIIFSNLFEGDYTLIVEAKNSLGERTKPFKFDFSISPPWYRTIYAYIIYLIVLIFAFWFAIKISKQRLEKKNQELEAIVVERTKEIAHQKEEIEEKHKEITDSINYAERIQNAMMMNDEHWQNFAEEHFIFFKPRDVVSGDFYWAYQNENFAIWAVADCTGHGVPGAFMSMLGIGFLNEIVIEAKIFEPAQILNKLREKIIKSLEQKGSDEERKDGMDISLCCWDKKQSKILFSGANNPLILLTKNHEKALSFKDEKMLQHKDFYLVTISGDKMPVGKYVKDETSFKQIDFQLDKGDLFYSFSDGFPDQFGGQDGKKFMIKRFKQLILTHANHNLETQKQIFDKQFSEWLEEGKTEQTDDVCVVAVRLE